MEGDPLNRIKLPCARNLALLRISEFIPRRNPINAFTLGNASEIVLILTHMRVFILGENPMNVKKIKIPSPGVLS